MTSVLPTHLAGGPGWADLLPRQDLRRQAVASVVDGVAHLTRAAAGRYDSYGIANIAHRLRNSTAF